jgi:hypothetical protein
MAKIDRIKEFIGYLKVVFGILVAIDVSVIGWVFKNQDILTLPKVLLSIITIVVTTVGIIVVNKKILQMIDELEELQ